MFINVIKEKILVVSTNSEREGFVFDQSNPQLKKSSTTNASERVLELCKKFVREDKFWTRGAMPVFTNRLPALATASLWTRGESNPQSLPCEGSILPLDHTPIASLLIYISQSMFKRLAT